MNKRLASLIEWLKKEDIDFAFITSTENIFYLSGFYSEPHERLLSLVVFQASDPILICPAMEQQDAKRAGWDYEMIGYSDIDQPWELLKTAVAKRIQSVKQIAIEREHLNVERYEILIHSFLQASFVSIEEKLRSLRLIKDKQEQKKLAEACQLADVAVETGVQEIREGKTELEILAAIEYSLKKQGVQQMAFSTMVLTGKNAASPHGTPGMTKIQKGDFILFDLGVNVDGYCSDITRTIAYDHLTDQQEEIYHIVLNAQLAAIHQCRPGVTCAELDQTARKIIHEAGYGDYFPHRLGHGLGISVHEYPSITETNELPLQEGMVFTIEPGIYVPNVAGVRIEDDIIITKNGCEILTNYPKELQIIK